MKNKKYNFIENLYILKITINQNVARTFYLRQYKDSPKLPVSGWLAHQFQCQCQSLVYVYLHNIIKYGISIISITRHRQNKLHYSCT
jgi:hypothetical protein